MPCAKSPSPLWAFDLDQSPEDRSDSSLKAGQGAEGSGMWTEFELEA